MKEESGRGDSRGGTIEEGHDHMIWEGRSSREMKNVEGGSFSAKPLTQPGVYHYWQITLSTLQLKAV